MCDTLCVRSGGGMLFAKSSDRPVTEPQVVRGFPARPPGGELRTQYLTIPDAGALALSGAQPDWLWGLEHGVNERRVAIGNERVYTTADHDELPAALIGMDLVRLGLERGATADAALDAMVELLEAHGQGGVADAVEQIGYQSSFLVVDPTGGWVLETCGRTWAARPVDDGWAISNDLTLTDDWTRAGGLAPGTSVGSLRDPDAWVAHATRRREATARAATDVGGQSPRSLVATLRHHGTRPWGAPGDDPGAVEPLPDPHLGDDGTGVSVCMHVRDYQATTASMVCALPADPDEPLRAWLAVGSPCASVYVPTFPAVADPPRGLGDLRTAARFAALRARVEAEPGGLAEVRAVLAPLEAALWDEADERAAALGRDAPAAAAFGEDAWRRVDAALGLLGTP